MLCSSRMRRCSQGIQVWGFTLQRDLEHPLGVGLHAVANLRPIRQHPAAGDAPHHRCSVAVQPCNGMNEVACAPPDPGGCCIIGFIEVGQSLVGTWRAAADAAQMASQRMHMGRLAHSRHIPGAAAAAVASAAVAVAAAAAGFLHGIAVHRVPPHQLAHAPVAAEDA